MWYVIQTRSGEEEKVRQLIESIFPRDIYDECKIIYSLEKRKIKGSWTEVRRRSLPGYIFLISNDIEKVYLELKNVPGMTKLLRTGYDILPISEKEELLIKRLANDEGIIEMSYGIQEGDRVIVTDGVLKGMESFIKKIDRHKRVGFIDIEMLNEVRRIQVGLEIVKKTT